METLSDILNPISYQFLLYLLIVITLFCVFYFLAARKQKQAIQKVDESLKRQEQANQQLHLIVRELRRSNRLLTQLADIEAVEMEEESVSESSPPSNSAEVASSPYKLYVGNIDYTATEEELASYFAPYGHVEFVNIPINRYNGKPRGFGFVTFSSKTDAERAMALHGTEFKGREIQVNFAKERDNN